MIARSVSVTPIFFHGFLAWAFVPAPLLFQTDWPVQSRSEGKDS